MNKLLGWRVRISTISGSYRCFLLSLNQNFFGLVCVPYQSPLSVAISLSPSVRTRAGWLGPLTTTFTPDPSCSVFELGIFFGDGGPQSQSLLISNNVGCESVTVSQASFCWPPVSSSLSMVSQTNDFGGFGFYSPGYVCPEGYVAACTAVSLSVGQIVPSVTGNFSFHFLLQGGETAYGCCPS